MDILSVVTIIGALLLWVAVVILGFGLSALYTARRYRLFEVIDRIQQLIIVARLASDDPDFGNTVLLTMQAQQSPAHMNIVFDGINHPFERNVIEGVRFHYLHPEVTAEQALQLLLDEIELYRDKSSRSLLWL